MKLNKYKLARVTALILAFAAPILAGRVSSEQAIYLEADDEEIAADYSFTEADEADSLLPAASVLSKPGSSMAVSGGIEARSSCSSIPHSARQAFCHEDDDDSSTLVSGGGTGVAVATPEPAGMALPALGLVMMLAVLLRRTTPRTKLS